ncbi:D-aspartate oxidase-like isoform X2 [Dreissena polymorpha]|uniref:FAD dependent oxidoreductase domain-containing protein n=1 Tax=Dreissena polymorpha TaxID=45954 RepID=A0A9D4R168_DREPO|nr:D-aspartate oxidase-like isoform X2 [Dreissena polymorpha]KAH3850333.1 hypothetical protein DPMN_092742 [Dreissena polymorpha]
MVKIGVIGAGVIGLSSALRVLERFPNADVTVIAAQFSPDTTTNVSGGFWEPHLLGETPESDIRVWSGKTFEHMQGLADSEHARATGATMVSGYRMTEAEEPVPFWKDLVLNFREMTEDELKPYHPMTKGSFFTTVMLDPALYLQWLKTRFQERGGRLLQRRLSSLHELLSDAYDVIINCTGTGARELLGDDKVQAVRGQVMRAEASWVRHFVICVGKDHLAYVLPSMNYVVLGGTRQVGDWDTRVRAVDRDHIWGICTKYMPSLKSAEVQSDHVGLRPSRTSVRLELERVAMGGKHVPVIHNYGHGGGGVTLHWGCADHVVSLVSQVIPANSRSQAKL